MTDQSNAPLLLIGNAGSGKSAIMAKSANDAIAKADRGELMSASGCRVFFHFVGATTGSTDLAFFLQWLSREINVSKMLNRSCELCLKTYGEKHMLMLRLYLNIGILNEDNRDLQKAYDYVVKWHETCLEVLGPSHPKTVCARDTLNEPTYVRIREQRKRQAAGTA